jgi:hypothetical protein
VGKPVHARPRTHGSEAALWAGIRFARKFFMVESPVDSAIERLTTRLEAPAIPHAVVGAMALSGGAR